MSCTLRFTGGNAFFTVGGEERIGERRFRVVSVEEQIGPPGEVRLRVELEAATLVRLDELHEPRIPEKVIAHAKARDEFLGALRKRRGGY